MRWMAVDTETRAFAPGDMRPPVACLQVCDSESPSKASIIPRHAVKKAWRGILSGACEGRWGIVGHNIAYDFACLLNEDPQHAPLLFEALDKGVVFDTMLALNFLGIAKAERKTMVSLADAAQKYLGRSMAKGDETGRTRFWELAHVPVAEWPETQRRYAEDDVLVLQPLLKAVYKACTSFHPELLCDMVPQVQQAFALQWIATEGLPVNREAVAALRKKYQAEHDALALRLQEYGLVRPSGSRNVGAIRERLLQYAKPEDIRYTPTGLVATDREAMALSEDDALFSAAKFNFIKSKALGTYTNYLERSPARLTPPFSNSCVQTGRISMSLHVTMPRDGGFRECVQPGPGKYLVAVDYDTAELRSLAQVCLWIVGHSELARVLQKPGADPHAELAARILGVSVDQAYAMKAAKDPRFKSARQSAKAPNFGFPGGMGPSRFAAAQKKQWVDQWFLKGQKPPPPIDETRARELKRLWLQQWPEMNAYFNHVSRLIRPDGTGLMRMPYSGRFRGTLGYCDLANSYFQGTTADGAKAGMYQIVKASLTEGHTLYGTKPCNFVHDENLVEVEGDRERASQVADAVAEIMKEQMQKVTPDIPVGASPSILNRWCKEESERDASGLWTVADAA